MRKKTHDEYVNEITSFDVYVIGVYLNARTPILHKCKKCGYEWNISPDNLLRGYGCPKCAGVAKYTTSEFIDALSKVTNTIEVVGEYIDSKTKIECKCLIDGHEWATVPRTLLKGHGCPVCAGNKKKTHLEYVSDVNRINENIEVVGEYISSDDLILHKCKIDGTEWFARPNNILSGRGCPKCKSSIGEKIIAEYLRENDIVFNPQHIFNDCKNIKVLPFDFYLPNYNTCIEYDGIQHFEPREFFGGEDEFINTVNRDIIKNNYCKQNNIRIIRIRYDEDIIDVLDNFFHNTKLLEEAV